MIPSNLARAGERASDEHLHKGRHWVEGFINKVKRFRRAATHHEKTAANFLAVVHLAGATAWPR